MQATKPMKGSFNKVQADLIQSMLKLLRVWELIFKNNRNGTMKIKRYVNKWTVVAEGKIKLN